ncbi:hypothetical protein MtrunA17_Chr2g0313301 [Medicago truncatula]|uniref:Transmembrane protein n=1 Tax=Medicago truncatula TaxID=3880 RepID=A0A396JBP2_MEDTR|nr:hypothetical protein MtrunA17_Chr2g0313301 [Medicago truncatula]
MRKEEPEMGNLIFLVVFVISIVDCVVCAVCPSSCAVYLCREFDFSSPVVSPSFADTRRGCFLVWLASLSPIAAVCGIFAVTAC